MISAIRLTTDVITFAAIVVTIIGAGRRHDRGPLCDRQLVSPELPKSATTRASEAKAKARAAFIQKSLKDIPTLGTEYDYIRGGALLHVVGVVKPSLAKKYNAAFGGTLFE